MENILNYYRTPSLITQLDKFRSYTEWLPDNVTLIYQVVQGLLIHDSWLEQYGMDKDKRHFRGRNFTVMEDIIDKALELENRTLAIPRAPEKRVIVCCREFATLFCAILRSKGIPARSRCGFASYFSDDYYEDHWICEYWNGSLWVKVDPQIDPLQQSSLYSWFKNSKKMNTCQVDRISNFNPLNLSEEDFIISGRAWLDCRKGILDPNKFGIGCDPKDYNLETLHGLWFIRGNLLRDFASLNKIETVPFLIRICNKLNWNSWRLVAARDEELSGDDWALLDLIAEFSCDADISFNNIIHTYESCDWLKVPEEILLRC